MELTTQLEELNRKAKQHMTGGNGSQETSCKYGECDGSGWKIIGERIEEQKAVACRCLLDENKVIKLNNMYKGSNIPKRLRETSIDSFRTDIYKEENRQQAEMIKKVCKNYIEDYEWFRGKGKGLYLHSITPGAGKTRMAISIANGLIREQKEEVVYTTTLNLLLAIRETYNNGAGETEGELLKRVQKADCLILDEIGVEKPSDFTEIKLYQIIDNRVLENKPTLFTSNLAIEDLALSDRTISRIRKMAPVLPFPEEDIRDKISAKEQQEILSRLYR